jgi:putative transcriptional regulator
VKNNEIAKLFYLIYNVKKEKYFGGRIMAVVFRVTLDELLKEKGLNQKQLIELIYEKTEKKIRPAAVSELYNNQRKSLNIELVETIVNVLEITDIRQIVRLERKDSN